MARAGGGQASRGRVVTSGHEFPRPVAVADTAVQAGSGERATAARPARRSSTTPRLLADAVTRRGMRMDGRRAHAILVDLHARGLVEASGGRWRLTDEGAAVARELREVTDS